MPVQKDHGATEPNPKQQNRYTQLISEIWRNHYVQGAYAFDFERAELVQAANRLGIKLPKNLGDVLYTFRYRGDLRKEIVDEAPQGYQWAINPAGVGKYRFELVKESKITPNELLIETKIPDATPGVISMHALTDEQALLAKLRYNRLLKTSLSAI